MKLNVIGSDNYAVRVIQLKEIHPIPGADNIVRASILGNDVIVNKAAEIGKLYLFFPSGCAINSMILSQGNEFKNKSLNADPLAPGGFFDDKGRVKSLRLRGVISTGFMTPFDFLSPLKVDVSSLKEGDSFTHINDILVVNKYVVMPKQQSQPGLPKNRRKLEAFSRIIPDQFKFHIKTPNLGYSMHVVKPRQLVSITNKLHGTSAVFSNVQVYKELSWWEKLLMKLGVNIVDREYANLYSSRTVLKNANINPNQNGHYKVDVWSKVNEEIKHKLEDGITIYGEIIGWLPGTNSPIQKGYTYKITEGSCEFKVYRITYTKPDGEVIEYNWTLLKYYCDKHGLSYVPEYFYGFTEELISDESDPILFSEEAVNSIKNKWVNESDDPLNPKMPLEGVVIRFCDDPHFKVFKLKNKRFILHESKMTEAEEVDIEEEQGEVENEM